MSRSRATLRTRVHEILEASGRDDPVGFAIDMALIALISANVIAVILESIDSVFVTHRELFVAFEALSVVVFTAEYGLRLWTACAVDSPTPLRDRLRWMHSGPALVDLAAILPFYLSAFFALDLRFLRVLRLLRVLKLTRYSAAMTMVFAVVYNERRGLGAAFSILAVVMILAASGIYLVEHDAQPVAFGSIPAAMWWAVSTLTTVGYGDVTPITPMGKVFAAIVTLVGIGTVALPTGLLASGFTELQSGKHRAIEQEIGDEAELCPHCGKELA